GLVYAGHRAGWPAQGRVRVFAAPPFAAFGWGAWAAQRPVAVRSGIRRRGGGGCDRARPERRSLHGGVWRRHAADDGRDRVLAEISAGFVPLETAESHPGIHFPGGNAAHFTRVIPGHSLSEPGSGSRCGLLRAAIGGGRSETGNVMRET